MPKKIQKICVIGDGGWGTTLSIHLAKQEMPVNLWGPFPQYVKLMARNRYNAKFLPGIRIPKKVNLIEDLKEAVGGCELILFAVPSKFSLSVIEKIKAAKIEMAGRCVLSVTKGIDHTHLTRISELIENQLNVENIAVLSGPTIAMEVAKGIPSSAVAASRDAKLAKQIQSIVNSNTFRIYTNSDVTGVELGGTLKNVIAIAGGLCDGLGYGTNTKSALLTRGLAEMTRLGKAMGARASTFYGLSGLGDLITTSFNEKSRNRTVGEKLAKGKTIDEITGKMDMVAEGVETAQCVMQLAQKHGVDMPISNEIYNIIYKRKKASQAVLDLMGRKATSE